MQDSYLPILILMGAAAALAGGMIVASAVIRPTKRSTAGDSPYECGMEVQGSARQRFPVRFYVVAMLFILFDLEAAFLFPWAVVYRRLGMFGLVEMLVFIAILLAGYVYAWRKGGLRWS
jgi:NADH-quinone oxidoreductase subunit A